MQIYLKKYHSNVSVGHVAKIPSMCESIGFDHFTNIFLVLVPTNVLNGFQGLHTPKTEVAVCIGWCPIVPVRYPKIDFVTMPRTSPNDTESSDVIHSLNNILDVTIRKWVLSG